MINELDERQRALADFMSELSEEAYCAGWMAGLEYALWRAVLEGPRRYGFLDINAEQIKRLRDLAGQCHGWIVFDDDAEESWLPMDEWEKRYASRVSMEQTD